MCKYSNVQSFFGVKPYCDLGAIGAKRGELGDGAGELDWTGEGGARGNNTYVLRCRVRVELFLFLKRRKKTSLYLQLQLTPNNHVAFAFSSLLQLSRHMSPLLLLLLVLPLLPPRPAPSSFALAIPLPSSSKCRRDLSAYLSHADTRRNSRNALEIIRYRPRECA